MFSPTPFAPQNGPSSGTLITLYGQNFGLNGTVYIGGKLVGWKSFGDTQVTVRVFVCASHANQVETPVGYGNVAVVLSGTVAGNFSYDPPTLTSVTPTLVPASQIVVLHGTSLSSITQANFSGLVCFVWLNDVLL